MAGVPVISPQAGVLPVVAQQLVPTAGMTKLHRQPEEPKLYPPVMSYLLANDLYSRFEVSDACK